MQSSSNVHSSCGGHMIPEHVPPELVREFDFRSGLGNDPHRAVAALHDGPRVFYSPAPRIALPVPGTWVLTSFIHRLPPSSHASVP
jgi:hypothetical protein